MSATSRFLASAPLRFLRRRDPLAFCLRACVLLVLIALLTVTTAFEKGVQEPLIAFNAWGTWALLRVFGVKAALETPYVGAPEFKVEIIPGCTGVYTMAILAAIIFAFPARWRMKLAGLALGILFVTTLNLVRLVTLFLIGQRFPSLFDEVHLFVWQAITIAIAILYWYLWARRALRGLEPAGAAAGPAA